MAKQNAKHPTAVKAEQQTKAERNARKAASALKRQTRLAKLAKQDPKKLATIINFREYKKHYLETERKQREESQTPHLREAAKQSDWDLFCEYKARAHHNYWIALKGKKDMGAKAVERKRKRLYKAREKMAELEKELEALGVKV